MHDIYAHIYYALSHYAVRLLPRYASLCHTILLYITLWCYTMLCYASLCFAVLCSVGGFPRLLVTGDPCGVTCHRLRLVLHCCVLLCGAMLCFAMLGYASLCFAVLRSVAGFPSLPVTGHLSPATSCVALLCLVMSCYAMLCCAWLCFAWLPSCHIVDYGDLLCFVMLRYALLCFARLEASRDCR